MKGPGGLGWVVKSVWPGWTSGGMLVGSGAGCCFLGDRVRVVCTIAMATGPAGVQTRVISGRPVLERVRSSSALRFLPGIMSTVLSACQGRVSGVRSVGQKERAP